MLTYEEAVKFHGHSGPFLAMGYRIGLHVVSELKPEGFKGLNCRVNLPLQTPYTCVVDGIQCSSSCTLGKVNIELESAPRGIRIVFKIPSGKSMGYEIRQDFIQGILKNRDLDAFAQEILEMPLKEFIDIQV
ncbi:formylmethanofuran dehydrogenase subunit E family protein [bacterium]|nr:formylmethanofuran dehydrogenase subunit E family protein [bacterium]